MTLYPAPVDTGVIFRRVDGGRRSHIPAKLEYVVDTRLSTTLGCGNYTVSTVEHLLAAVSGLGIDNLYVDIDASELPIMDGSASVFVFLLESAGIELQDAPKKYIRIKKKVEFSQGDKWVRLEPHESFKVAFTIDFDHPVFDSCPKAVEVDFSSVSFVREISRSRTFGFFKDHERLHNLGLAKGVSLKNTIVVDHQRVLNENGLRFKDEFVKHKILDAIGDMHLLGKNIIGSFAAAKSGHTLNHKLLKKLLADGSAWEIVH